MLYNLSKSELSELQREFDRDFYHDDGYLVERMRVSAAASAKATKPADHRVQSVKGESKRSSAKSGDGNNDAEPAPEPEPARPHPFPSLLSKAQRARKLLGVDDDATADEIRTLCRALASKNHPDRGGDPSTMAAIFEARDELLLTARKKPHVKLVVSPLFAEMEVFAKRVKVDLAAAYLALERIQKWGLSLDHPRAEKLARAERNRFLRGQWSLGVSLDRAEALAGSSDHAGADLENHREQCRSATADFRYAPQGWGDDAGEITRERIEMLLKLKHALKPRDRETIELRFEKGLSIKEIAVEKGQSDKAIYAAFARMCKILPGALERKLWTDEHCSAEGSGDAPVILEKNQQLGWDLGSIGGAE